MKSVNVLLSELKSQTNYGPGSSSLDHRERWPCMVCFDYLTRNTAPHFITLICYTHTRNSRLDWRRAVGVSHVQTDQSGRHVSFSQDCGVCVH